MENLKISGVSRRTLKISFMWYLKKNGVSRRTLKILFALTAQLFFGKGKRYAFSMDISSIITNGGQFLYNL